MNYPIKRITNEERIEVPRVPLVLDKKFVGVLTPTSVTPDVQNNEHWKANNTAPVTITNFLHGQDGQQLLIEGDGQTTLQHGTHIFLAGAADLLLVVNTIYHLLYRAGRWIQVS